MSKHLFKKVALGIFFAGAQGLVAMQAKDPGSASQQPSSFTNIVGSLTLDSLKVLSFRYPNDQSLKNELQKRKDAIAHSKQK